MGSEQKLGAMERDYFYPKIADRDAPSLWAEKDALDAWAAAKQKARDILASHQPDYLDKATDSAIKDRFNIL